MEIKKVKIDEIKAGGWDEKLLSCYKQMV